jgi:hypothetical protein
MIGLLLRMSHAAGKPMPAPAATAFAEIAAPRFDTAQETQVIQMGIGDGGMRS